MKIKITSKMLKKIDACQGGIDLFYFWFGKKAWVQWTPIAQLMAAVEYDGCYLNHIVEEGVLPLYSMHGQGLSGVDFSYTDFVGWDFSESDLSRSHIDACEIKRCDFSRCDLRSVNFTASSIIVCDLVFADLRGANLMDVDFVGSRLYHADLRGCKLHDVRFFGADLRRVRIDESQAMYLPKGWYYEESTGTVRKSSCCDW